MFSTTSFQLYLGRPTEGVDPKVCFLGDELCRFFITYYSICTNGVIDTIDMPVVTIVFSQLGNAKRN